jgi:thioredoxin 1
MNKKTLRNIVVLLIIGVVVVGGFLFNRIRHSPMSSEPEVAASAPQQNSQEEMDLSQEKENIVESRDKVVGPEEKKIVTLAIVNERVVTSEDFDRELESLAPEYRGIFEEEKEEFLDQLITMEILLQEAERQGLAKEKEVQEQIAINKEKRREILIQELVEKVTGNVEVSIEELRALYEEVKAEIPEKSFEEVKAQLKTYLIQQKQNKKLEEKIEELRSTARITKNEEWLKTQRLATTDNPLDQAFKKGRPVLADFGRGVCIPCKQMKPILEELAAEYKGKASVLIIEIDQYRALTRRYSIRLIPTQIFFDAQRKEVYRHEGFMSKESMKEKFEEMGVK